MRKVNGQRYLYRRGNVLVFRRSVPKAARNDFGKSEVVVTLKAGTVADACREMLPLLSQFEDRLLAARSRRTGNVATSDPDFGDMEMAVRTWFSDRQTRLAASTLRITNEQRQNRLKELSSYEAVARETVRDGDPGALHSKWIAEHIAEQNNWSISASSDQFALLLRIVARGQLEASRREREDLEGLPASEGDRTFSDQAYQLDAERRKSRQPPCSIMGLFEGYVKERKPSAATTKAWKRQLASLIAFLEHDDANRVSAADVVAWKDHLLSKQTRQGTPLSAKTVNDTYLSVLRTIFGWAVDNEKLRGNPAAKVKVRVQRKASVRSSGLTDEEAEAILANTTGPYPKRLSPERRFARRWVPWLCAYTGARVNEITQLRAEDVFEVGQIVVLRITPEAGSVKNHRARLVPLHPHLIEQGFVDCLKGKRGPLFYDPAQYKGGSLGNPQSKKVGEHLAAWVRALGINHPDVQPNHGWRHRFKTEARRANLVPEVREAIQGHATRTEGEAYGDFPPDVMLREIKKLRRYVLTKGSTGPSVRKPEKGDTK